MLWLFIDLILIFCIAGEKISLGVLTIRRKKKILPYSRKTVRSSLVSFHNVNKRCGMRRMFFQSTVAHKCIEDHYVDLQSNDLNSVSFYCVRSFSTFRANNSLKRMRKSHVNIHVILGAHYFKWDYIWHSVWPLWRP